MIIMWLNLFKKCNVNIFFFFLLMYFIAKFNVGCLCESILISVVYLGNRVFVVSLLKEVVPKGGTNIYQKSAYLPKIS